MNFWIFRTDSFGNPFRNVDSGRRTEWDCENNKRMEIAKKNYLNQFMGNKKNLNILETYPAEEIDWVAENARWVYPTVFSPLVWGFMKMYTRPSSLYIRKVAVVLSAIVSFQIGVRHQVKQENLYLLRNYPKFDQAFKDALETNDSRYMLEYFQVDETQGGDQE